MGLEVGSGTAEVAVKPSVGSMDLIQPNICDGRGPLPAKTLITQPSFLNPPSTGIHPSSAQNNYITMLVNIETLIKYFYENTE